MSDKFKTLKVRVKDKHSKQLIKMASSVNFVWNYINELSYRSIRERGVFLSAFDMSKYTAGASVELGILSGTLYSIANEYASKRRKAKKAKLSWRSAKRSLGWIPINTAQSFMREGKVFYCGHYFDIWDSYGLENYKFRTASFNQDSRGRWYFNVVVPVNVEQSASTASIGIDLGCKESVTTSKGAILVGRWYRDAQDKLAAAQRSKNKHRVRAIHAKIKNTRKDDLQKFSSLLVKDNAAIFVGNVSSLKLIKTKMAKSINDAGWGMFKTMLEYKCDHAGVVFEEIDESYTTVTCSVCKNRTGPRGLEGLRIREWTCECGVTHDRDCNSARNILVLGHEHLAVGIQ